MRTRTGIITGSAAALHTSGRMRKVTAFPYDVLANSASGRDPCRVFLVSGDPTGKVVEYVGLDGETVTLTEDDLAFDSFPVAVKSFTDNTTVNAILVLW